LKVEEECNKTEFPHLSIRYFWMERSRDGEDLILCWIVLLLTLKRKM
jgi:hypothetical protein